MARFLVLITLVAALATAAQAADCTTVYEAAKGTPDLSTLATAVEAANLTALLDDPALVATVFAPTNKAFAAALNALDASADELLTNTDLLTEILAYHVVVGAAAKAKDVKSGMELETANGDAVTVELVGKNVMLKTVSGGNATVIKPDITACKSVVHVIDSVLVPSLEPQMLAAMG